MAGAKTYQTVATIGKSEGIPLSTVSSGRVWSSFPTDFALAQNETHVWLAGLDDAGLGLQYFADSLSLAERDRAARFKFVLDRRRYLVAHAALRSILAAYLTANPRELQFGSGPHGKPKLASETAHEIEFNLSHSHELALLAVTRGREIGIDVEHVRQDFAFDEVAKRFFTAREVAALGALPRALQREAFYRCWTSKEALLKGKGTGLSGSLDEVQIRLAVTGVRVTAAVDDWSLIELSPIGGYAAALAVQKLYCELRCYRWDPSFLESKHHP
jgi:4'-phosphopantetheinyl transferase